MPRKNKKGKQGHNPSPNSVSYTGPIMDAASAEQNDTISIAFAYTAALTSNGSGVIAVAYGSTPTSASDWSSMAAIWEEYRVLAWEVIYRPSNRYSRAVVTQPIIAVIDRANSTILGSYTGAASHESARFRDLDDPFNIRLHMSGTDESAWQLTASAVNVNWIKFYADTLANSTQYGLVFVRARVQFRGRN